jgi:NAD(P)H-dependent FMN reductase
MNVSYLTVGKFSWPGRENEFRRACSEFGESLISRTERPSGSIVSGEYNHGIPPALKNLLDHFLEEYFFRPSAVVCYSAGQFGGVRAAMQLRMTLAELGMSSIPSLLPIPRVQEAFTPAGDPTDAAFERHSERFFRELEWYAQALQQARANGVPY